MDGYSVDGDDLRHAENLVRELARTFADSASLKYSIAVKEVGNAELARALAEFHDRSRTTAEQLCAVTTEAADRLHDTAAHYADSDRSTADAIAGDGELDSR